MKLALATRRREGEAAGSGGRERGRAAGRRAPRPPGGDGLGGVGGAVRKPDPVSHGRQALGAPAGTVVPSGLAGGHTTVAYR